MSILGTNKHVSIIKYIILTFLNRNNFSFFYKSISKFTLPFFRVYLLSVITCKRFLPSHISPLLNNSREFSRIYFKNYNLI